jgi:hypothetical protein
VRGNARVAKGDPDARLDLERFLELAPNDENAPETRRWLATH